MSDNPITPLSQGGVGVIRRLFGPAATELGEALADRVRVYRAKNLKRILAKAEREIGTHSFKELPLRFSIPFMDRASLEDDENLSNLWAKLLSQAAVDLRDEHHLYSRILGNLTPNSVELLNWLVGEFVEREDWYSELNWSDDWQYDLARFIESNILPKCEQDASPDPAKIAQDIFDFEHDKPFWVFRVTIPIIMKEIREHIDRGGDKDDFGQVIAPLSIEHSSLQILERENLVVRRTADLNFDYCSMEITYAAVTSLGAELVKMGRRTGEQQEKV